MFAQKVTAVLQPSVQDAATITPLGGFLNAYDFRENWSEREEHNPKSSNRFHINNLLTMLTFVVSHCSGKVFRSPVPGKILEGLWHVDHTCSVETELTMHG